MSTVRSVIVSVALVALTSCGRLGYERQSTDGSNEVDAVRIDAAQPPEDTRSDAVVDVGDDQTGNVLRDGAARVCGSDRCFDDVERFEVGSRRYALLREDRPFADSADTCAHIGMILARIESREEHAALWANTDGRVTWIGGSDVSVEGEWRWIEDGVFWRGSASGAPVGGAFQSWGVGEPNNLVTNGNDEDCLTLWPSHDGGWNDEPCARRYQALCEQR